MQLLTVQPSGLHFAARTLLWPDLPPQHTRPAALITVSLLLNTTQANEPLPLCPGRKRMESNSEYFAHHNVLDRTEAHV